MVFFYPYLDIACGKKNEQRLAVNAFKFQASCTATPTTTIFLHISYVDMLNKVC